MTSTQEAIASVIRETLSNSMAKLLDVLLSELESPPSKDATKKQFKRPRYQYRLDSVACTETLTHLSKHPEGMTTQELATKISAHHSNTNSVLRTLMEAGLVVKTTDSIPRLGVSALYALKESA